MTSHYRCYIDGKYYGEGPIDYMRELFVDYVITCEMYGRGSVDWRVEKVYPKKKITLREGEGYRSRATGDVMFLCEDYNGLWYLANRSEIGYRKTLSQSPDEMIAVLEKYYEKITK